MEDSAGTSVSGLHCTLTPSFSPALATLSLASHCLSSPLSISLNILEQRFIDTSGSSSPSEMMLAPRQGRIDRRNPRSIVSFFTWTRFFFRWLIISLAIIGLAARVLWGYFQSPQQQPISHNIPDQRQPSAAPARNEQSAIASSLGAHPLNSNRPLSHSPMPSEFSQQQLSPRNGDGDEKTGEPRSPNLSLSPRRHQNQMKRCPTCNLAHFQPAKINMINCRCKTAFCYVCGQTLAPTVPYLHFCLGKCALFNQENRGNSGAGGLIELLQLQEYLSPMSEPPTDEERPERPNGPSSEISENALSKASDKNSPSKTTQAAEMPLGGPCTQCNCSGFAPFPSSVRSKQGLCKVSSCLHNASSHKLQHTDKSKTSPAPQSSSQPDASDCPPAYNFEHHAHGHSLSLSASSPAKPNPSKSGLSKRSFTCIVCHKSRKIDAIFVSSVCGRHEVCRSCMHFAIQTQIAQNTLPISCPVDSCDALISEDEVGEFLDAVQFSVYQSALQDLSEAYPMPTEQAEEVRVTGARDRPAATDALSRVREEKCEEDEKRLVVAPTRLFNFKEKFRCLVCYDELPQSEMFISDGCKKGHRFCLSCVKIHAEVLVKDFQIPVNCPFSTECKGTMTDSEVSRFLSPQHARLYLKRRQEQKAALDSNLVICPTPDCGASYSIPVAQQVAFFKCTKCRHSWCLQCKTKAHPAKPCPMVKESDDLDPKAAKALGLQACPGCKTWVEKTSECNHMVCKLCKTDFCYQCGEKIEITRNASGQSSIQHFLSGACCLFDRSEVDGANDPVESDDEADGAAAAIRIPQVQLRRSQQAGATEICPQCSRQCHDDWTRTQGFHLVHCCCGHRWCSQCAMPINGQNAFAHYTTGSCSLFAQNSISDVCLLILVTSLRELQVPASQRRAITQQWEPFQCDRCSAFISDPKERCRVETCNHALCRTCLTFHIRVGIRNNEYPILCPMCPNVPSNKMSDSQVVRLLESLDVSFIQQFFENKLLHMPPGQIPRSTQSQYLAGPSPLPSFLFPRPAQSLALNVPPRPPEFGRTERVRQNGNSTSNSPEEKTSKCCIQ